MSAEIAGGVGAVALFAVPGYGLTELFATLRAKPPAARAAYGYLLGIGCVSGSLFALSHLFAVPLRPPAIWCAAAAPTLVGLAAAAVRRHSVRHIAAAAAPCPARDAPRAGAPTATGWRAQAARWITIACALLAALLSLAAFAEAVSNPVSDWDGRMTWATQARYVRQAGTVDAPVLRQAPWYVTHPQYPLLLPLAQVAVLEAFHGDPDSHAVRALYAAFLPALLLIVWDGARRTAGSAAAALAALALAATPFMSLGAGGPTTAYSDLPLACFYAAALTLALGPRPRASDALVTGLLLAAMALTKNEGALLALVPLALGWRAARKPPAPVAGGARVSARLRRAVAAALPLAAALALLDAWRLGIVNRQDEDYPDLIAAGHAWSHVWLNLRRIAPVLVEHTTSWATWGGFWWLALALLAAGWRTLRHPLHRRLLLAAAAPAAIGLAAYSIHPVAAFAAQLTWDRLLLQGAAPLVMVLAGAVAELARPFGRRRQPTPAAAPPLAG
jgi:Dolichyl-phosphate-mannose-protein mannosyltransferase